MCSPVNPNEYIVGVKVCELGRPHSLYKPNQACNNQQSTSNQVQTYLWCAHKIQNANENMKAFDVGELISANCFLIIDIRSAQGIRMACV